MGTRRRRRESTESPRPSRLYAPSSGCVPFLPKSTRVVTERPSTSKRTSPTLHRALRPSANCTVSSPTGETFNVERTSRGATLKKAPVSTRKRSLCWRRRGGRGQPPAGRRPGRPARAQRAGARPLRAPARLCLDRRPDDQRRAGASGLRPGHDDPAPRPLRGGVSEAPARGAGGRPGPLAPRVAARGDRLCALRFRSEPAVAGIASPATHLDVLLPHLRKVVVGNALILEERQQRIGDLRLKVLRDGFVDPVGRRLARPG